MYYRQAAAAAAVTLQKPLPYRLYPPSVGLGLPGPSAHLGAGLATAPGAALTSLAGYYNHNSHPAADGLPPRSPTPDTPLDPGSPNTAGPHSASDDEDTIHV